MSELFLVFWSFFPRLFKGRLCLIMADEMFIVERLGS